MSKYKGKKVLVVGFGASGVAVARYMAKQGAKVIVTDQRQRTELMESVAAVEDLKIEYELGKHNPLTFKSVDLIVQSSSIASNLKPLAEAREAGIAISNEVDIAALALKEPLIAITGTNGKSTTAQMIQDMFKADHKNAYLGGQDGKSLIDYVTEGSKADVVIGELSAFQLELTQKVVPAVAIFTNVDADHMDRYQSIENYVASKKKLLTACDRNSYVILNYDNAVTQSFGAECAGKVIWITKKNPMQIGGGFAENFVGAYYSAGQKKIIAKINGREEHYDVSAMKVYGEHNKENLMAAICAARLMGVAQAAIQTVIGQFKGLPHRLEFVRRKDGVFFFNDSKSTNPTSLERAVLSFPANPIILIAGGRDLNADYAHISQSVQARCKLLILMGEAKEKLNRFLGDFLETYLVGTFEEAVLLAFQKSRNNDIILLSPGCSHLDLFRTYEERGDYFKKLVQQL